MAEIHETGLEFGEPINLPPSITLDHFWKSVDEGTWRRPRRRKIEAIVNRYMFKHEPLTKLTNEENEILKKRMVDYIYQITDYFNYKELTIQTVRNLTPHLQQF